MFKIPDDYAIQKQSDEAERNYTVQQNDQLRLEVFTNNGERLVDPNNESQTNNINGNLRTVVDYLVDTKGIVKFPMIGEIHIEGLTLREAEEIIQKEFAKFYQQPFAVLKYANKRVIVLGSTGGQLIPLVNQNVKLAEVLAMARGIDVNGKAHNIRILRGEKVFVADLSTISGYLKNNIIIEPGDVVYVEPVRRPFIEVVRDYGSLLGIATSVIALILVITN